MANDFSDDSNCKALWRFESGALTTDSRDTNTLTPSASSPTEDTSDFKEGACAADFEADNDQYFYRNNSDLSSGFPLKSGDISKLCSVAFWIKIETNALSFIYALWENNKFTFTIVNWAGTLLIWNGFNNGLSSEDWQPVALTAGRWYHIGVVHDGVNRTGLVRIWDSVAETATTYTHNWGNQTSVIDSALTIAKSSPGGSGDLDAKLDELVVFNDLLSADEIDQIRQGTYGAASIPDPPGNVHAVAGDEQNTISWDASEGATSYNIYWDFATGVTKETGTKIEGVTSPHIHDGLENGIEIFYVITAVNDAGESDESVEVSATPVQSLSDTLKTSMFLVI